MFGAGLLVIAATLAVAMPTCVMAMVQGNASGRAFMSIARQPEVSQTIRTLLLVALAFMETLAIYGLLISLMLVTRIVL